MKYYFAPMEGITLYPLRNIHKEMFGEGVDKYFTPFVTAAKTYHFKKREQRDILPEYSRAFADYRTEVVPQIMGNQAETIIWAAKKMNELGYKEVNINLGCPVATVVNRHKGAGLLEDPDKLDQMLYEIFDAREKENLPFDISLKTRLGMSDEAEATRLMEIYAKYPISELIIHARIREDYYKGAVRLDAFNKAVDTYKAAGGAAPICYNGDIGSINMTSKQAEFANQDADRLNGQHDGAGLDSAMMPASIANDSFNLMIGRGLLTNPALVRELRGGEKLSAQELSTYLDRLYEGYEEYIPEDRNVIFKMLEHWAFIHVYFKDCDKYLKAIRKSRSKGEYKAAVRDIFSSCEFI